MFYLQNLIIRISFYNRTVTRMYITTVIHSGEITATFPDNMYSAP